MLQRHVHLWKLRTAQRRLSHRRERVRRKRRLLLGPLQRWQVSARLVVLHPVRRPLLHDDALLLRDLHDCRRQDGGDVRGAPDWARRTSQLASTDTFRGACNESPCRLCAPYAPTGVFVCQPASGCHVNGDLCRETSDCCGTSGTGLPGDGNVTCDKAAGAAIGICRNPQSCNPQGNVCHFKNYACSSGSSARNDCCSAVGSSGRCIKDSQGVLRCNNFNPEPCVGLAENDSCSLCQLDALGVPRCNGLGACRKSSDTCASAADCCDGLPCVPDGSGALRCYSPPDGGATCVPAAGACTINADCCPGGSCITPIGSTVGSCSTPPLPPGSGGTPGSGGASSGGTANAGGAGGTTSAGGAGGTTSAGGPPRAARVRRGWHDSPGGSAGAGGACSLYGQKCTTTANCCSEVRARAGICVIGPGLRARSESVRNTMNQRHGAATTTLDQSQGSALLVLLSSATALAAMQGCGSSDKVAAGSKISTPTTTTGGSGQEALRTPEAQVETRSSRTAGGFIVDSGTQESRTPRTRRAGDSVIVGRRPER